MDPRDDKDRPAHPETLRSAETRPETWDASDNSVEVCFSTGVRALKRDWRTDELYLEDLPLAGMDVSELNAGAHVLRAHEKWGLESILGSVVPGTARVENGEALARVKLSTTPSDAETTQKIRDGIIRKWSYGYARNGNPVLSRDEATGYEVRTWASHTPYEISPVPVPADPGTGTRSRRSQEDEQMDPEKTPPAKDDENRQDDEALRAAREEGARQEAQRQKDIRAVAAKLRLGDDDVRKYIEDPKVTVEAFRAAAIDLAAARDEQTETHPQHGNRVTMQRDETDTFRSLATSALAHRARPDTKLEDGARQFVVFGFADLARECLRRQGVRGVEYMGKDELFNRALGFERGERAASTSDFPLILADASNKNFRAGMAAVVENFLPLVERRTVADFKDVHELQLSSAPTLDETPEGMEIKYGTLSEGRETWSILSYTKGWRITRKAMINDDTGALGTVPARFGGGVTRTKLNLFWALITGNRALADSKGIFHADHANVTASGGAPPDVTEIGKGRKLMRLQKDIGGKDELNLIPEVLVIPAALETGVEQLLTQTTPAETSKAIPNSVKSLAYIVEPRLDAASVYFWYLFTTASQWPNFVLGELAGAQGPRFRSRESWDVQGMEYQVEYDCGFAPIDSRGCYRNKGQA